VPKTEGARRTTATESRGRRVHGAVACVHGAVVCIHGTVARIHEAAPRVHEVLVRVHGTAVRVYEAWEARPRSRSVRSTRRLGAVGAATAGLHAAAGWVRRGRCVAPRSRYARPARTLQACTRRLYGSARLLGAHARQLHTPK
jgi:hypothetical protein